MFMPNAKFKNYLWDLPLPGAPNQMGPPSRETQQTSNFIFSNLYTSMVTKNKIVTFPAKLTSWLLVNTRIAAGPVLKI